MKKILLAATSIVLALSATSALAADLPSRKGPPPAYLPPPPAFSWNGLYGGVNIGYGFGNGDTDVGSLGYIANAAPLPSGAVWGLNNDLNGVVGGGQIGYNWQFSPWLVLGVEADIQAADLRTQSSAVGASPSAIPFGPHAAIANSSKSVDWYGSVRGRIGVTPFMPNLMIYGTAGFAYGQTVHHLNVTDVYSFGGLVIGSSHFDDTKTGWTAGGGVEWSPSSFPAWSLKVEYLYTDLGATNLSGVSFATLPPGGPVFGFTNHSETRFHTVKAGLNWHFNPFAPAAVIAKY
jgi:opacity protein-like surface antigen